MSIAGMVIWALTAGIGIYLLAVGISAQRAATLARTRAAAAATAAAAAAQLDSAAGEPAVGTQALAVVMSGGGGPAPAAPVEGSPLLEFTHPALALLGLTFWIFFVMTGDRLFAWIAFGVVVATVVAGLSWEISRRRTAWQRAAGDGDAGGRDGAADGPGFPPHLVLAHGAAAACTFALVVIAAVAAGHG